MDKFEEFLRRHVDVRSKVWLEEGGSPLIGVGRAELLRAIERTGSINAAARELRMDYHRAWGLIDSMEQRLPFRLVVRQRGGSGRGTTLTDEGRRLLELYGVFERGAQGSVDRRFRKIFRQREKGKDT